jgi:OPA family glycerol-3-phosphate transporter-like MFS transporter
MVALLVTGYSGYYLCRSNLSVSMPLIVEDLASPSRPADAVRVWVGSIASLGVLAYALGKIPSGRMADRFGGRGNFLGGMAGAVVATALFAAGRSLPMLTVAWIANRLLQTLGWAGAIKIVSRWFPFHRHGTVMGIISLSYLFGDALARQFLSVLIRLGFTWRSVFASSAAVLALILAICLVLLRESPGGDGAPENPSGLFRAAEAAGWRQVFTTFFRSRAFLYACVLSLGATILRETFNLWTPTYFTQAIHMSAADAAAASSIFPLLGGISVIVCGFLGDRLGRTGRAVIILGGMSGAALLLLRLSAAPAASAWSAMAAVGALALLTIGPYSFLAGAIALDFGGKRAAATASGIIDTAGYLGGVLSGDTMARISIGFGWSGTFRLLAGIAFLTALAAVLFLREHRRVE